MAGALVLFVKELGWRQVRVHHYQMGYVYPIMVM
jgi:hypothetical protein